MSTADGLRNCSVHPSGADAEARNRGHVGVIALKGVQSPNVVMNVWRDMERNPAVDVTVESQGIGIGRLAAGAYVVMYLIVAFRPFVLLRPLPGSVGWGLLPMVGVGALLVAPAERLSRVPVSFAFLAVATWFSMSLAWTQSFSEGFFLVRSQVPALVLLVLVVGTMRPAETIRILIVAFSAIAVWSLVASLLVTQARVADIGTIPGDAVLQEGWRGTFVHKNVLGVFAVMGAVLAFVFVRRSGLRVALLLLFTALILGTRSATAAGGLIAVVGAASWLTWMKRIDNHRGRALAKIGSVILVIVAITTVSAVLPFFADLYGKDLTFSGRTEIWSASWDTIMRQPWIGYGSGTVWHDQTSVETFDLRRRIGFRAAHAHSGVLDLLLAGGVIGLALFVVALLGLARLAARLMRSTPTVAHGQWITITLLGIGVMSISEPLFEGPFLGYMVIMWSVAASAVNRTERNETENVVTWATSPVTLP